MSTDINAPDLSVAPGGQRPAGTLSIPTQRPLQKSAVYFDGFNLYHGIKDLKLPHLRWLDLWALSKTLTNSSAERLEKVVWCTAALTTDHEKLVRHRAYKKALESVGVTCAMGHFIKEPVKNQSEDILYWKDTEKEGDIHVALHLMMDGVDDIYDNAYLVTADSDQAATAKMFKSRFQPLGKKLISVAPPGRTHSQHVIDNSDRTIQIKQSVIEACLFPAVVQHRGRFVVNRPPFYDPPAGWRPAPTS